MKVEIFRRTDGKFAWHVIADNARRTATDGGQGYEHRRDAVSDASATVKPGLPIVDVETGAIVGTTGEVQ